MKYIITVSKNHIELLVPGQIWDRIRDPKILSKFWSRTEILNRYVLGNDRGCLIKRTDSNSPAGQNPPAPFQTAVVNISHYIREGRSTSMIRSTTSSRSTSANLFWKIYKKWESSSKLKGGGFSGCGDVIQIDYWYMWYTPRLQVNFGIWVHGVATIFCEHPEPRPWGHHHTSSAHPPRCLNRCE
jgi:hypothetical protein